MIGLSQRRRKWTMQSPIKRATLEDVARAAGVGPMTVSRTINGHPYVAEETAKKVRAAIRRLGYRPNHAARMLTGQLSRSIGLIVPDIADTFFSVVMSCSSRDSTRERLSGVVGRIRRGSIDRSCTSGDDDSSSCRRHPACSVRQPEQLSQGAWLPEPRRSSPSIVQSRWPRRIRSVSKTEEGRDWPWNILSNTATRRSCA